jgi:hypothetical protein
MMSTVTTIEEATVDMWRYERLLAAHCPAPTAMTIAHRRDVDLHAAVALLARGCPPQTALDILL